MQWTTDTPKESGFYWHRCLKRFQNKIALTTRQLKGESPHFDPAVVRVTIDHSDSEWPREVYSSCNYEMEWDLSITNGDLWAGPIPIPPSEI